eukprot:TRINITY_DN554_c0_g1_i1.p1 TRINITY_DN554_c0_g1~~TRINITY_DN554_c0_g1_i1.p1  ORF type:complete len:541 (-),score=162.32 TRINITY_DN554_c0_g1_i1:301-1923(-)
MQLFSACLLGTLVAFAVCADWPSFGYSTAHNDRYQRHETAINASNAGLLQCKWKLTFSGGVLATPTVGSDGTVYIADCSGNVTAIDGRTSKIRWRLSIPAVVASFNITGIGPGANSTALADSRATATLYNNTLFIGTQLGALLLSINCTNGTLNWAVQAESHFAAILTQSPTVYNGIVYVGVASVEEISTTEPSFNCCTFRGSFAAYRASDGSLVWRQYLMPDNQGQPGGYAGAAVWSSSPVIDTARNSVYIATGNAYSYPMSVYKCIDANPVNDTEPQPRTDNPCLADGDYANSVLALDLTSGTIKWAQSLGPLNAWCDACEEGGPTRQHNCPETAGFDADFGQCPILVPGSASTPGGQDVLLAGQKSGVLWAFQPGTGKVIYASVVAPGGVHGGLQWGSACDGATFFFASANSDRRNHTLLNGTTITGGSWGAARVLDGKLLWNTANPTGAQSSGPVSLANGVVYATSKDTLGMLYALDAVNGTILFGHQLGRVSSSSGPSIVNGVVYAGAGGRQETGFLLAFELPTNSTVTALPSCK